MLNIFDIVTDESTYMLAELCLWSDWLFVLVLPAALERNENNNQ